MKFYTTFKEEQNTDLVSLFIVNEIQKDSFSQEYLKGTFSVPSSLLQSVWVAVGDAKKCMFSG